MIRRRRWGRRRRGGGRARRRVFDTGGGRDGYGGCGYSNYHSYRKMVDMEGDGFRGDGFARPRYDNYNSRRLDEIDQEIEDTRTHLDRLEQERMEYLAKPWVA
uniref:Uncharacterized protein n=1 Tax=Ditylenchus dipsaci TaxID=166011 RepID=A0A915CXX7_9BILA